MLKKKKQISKVFKNTLVLPKKIYILGREWRILIKKDIKMTETLGFCNFEKHTIVIKKGWKDIVNVLSHEVAHAFIFETQFVKNTEANASVLGLLIEDMMKQVYFKNKKDDE